MATAAVEGADTPMEDAPPEHHITIDDKPTELTGPLDEPHRSRADPDAQTTVTDFLDFTEYLPSDIVRSLTLIGKLDETYEDASINVDELTRKWGQLPSLDSKDRPSPVQLRADISEQLSQALSSRVASHAEAVKVSETINRHYQKVQVLLSKLQTMMDNYPTEQELLERQASKSPQLSRSKPAVKAGAAGEKKVRRHRAPRITVPGEVLAPYEIEYDDLSDSDDESSEEDDDVVSNRRTPGPIPRIKLSTNKTPKSVNRTAQRSGPLVSAAMTAAQIANAAALAKPPPPDAVIGSADAPWLQLTQYELAKLRKRMKKNATWTPSETMVARELKALGRGPDDYREAKKKAEDAGSAFDAPVPAPVEDKDSGTMALPAGAIGVDSLASQEVPTSNRGMKLNEAKKLKKDAMAKLAAEDAEESLRKMSEQAKLIYPGAATSISSFSESPKDAKSAKQPKGNSRSTNKRKREETERPPAVSPAPSEPPPPAPLPTAAPPAAKRTKTETPVPLPHNIKTRHNSGSNAEGQNSSTANPPPAETPVPVPLNPLSASSSVVGAAKSPTPGVVRPSAPETPVPVPRVDRRKSTTVVPLPQDTKPTESKRETRGEAAKRAQQQEDAPPEVTAPELVPEQSSSQRRRSSRAVTPAVPSEEAEASTTRRPSSISKATSQEPQPSAGADRSRRTSTARNTPAPDARPAIKRLKRPAPGVVSTTSSGSSSAVGKRKSAPKKKARVRKEKGQATDEMEEVDDEGNPIDPNEPKYCYCNRVSFGTMIKCDNEVRETDEDQLQLSSGRTLRSSVSEDIASKGCKYEWFHLECVGLTSEPAETTKWYCPDCRKLLNIGEKGQVNVRGVKK